MKDFYEKSLEKFQEEKFLKIYIFLDPIRKFFGLIELGFSGGEMNKCILGVFFGRTTDEIHFVEKFSEDFMKTCARIHDGFFENFS